MLNSPAMPHEPEAAVNFTVLSLYFITALGLFVVELTE